MYNNYSNFKKSNKFVNYSIKNISNLNERSLEQNEEYELIASWQNNKDNKSLNRLLGAFKKLVVSFSKKYMSYGLSQEDLVQEGMMGLIHAINRFDISKGFRLSTYAHWWIKAMMQDFILKNWSIVKNSTTASQKKLFFSFNKIKKLINFDSIKSMNFNDIEKISKLLNLKPLDIQNLETRLKMGDQSLNQIISFDNDGVELISLLKDERPSHDKVIENKNDNKIKKDWLLKAMNLLTDREKYIINSRKYNDKPETLDKIGKELKISKERVRQIEVNSLQKLQKNILKISNQNKNFFVN